jgi:hypothetical protein
VIETIGILKKRGAPRMENSSGLDATKVGADKKDNAADVARDGFDALMSGKDHVSLDPSRTRCRRRWPR